MYYTGCCSVVIIYDANMKLQSKSFVSARKRMLIACVRCVIIIVDSHHVSSAWYFHRFRIVVDSHVAYL